VRIPPASVELDASTAEVLVVEDDDDSRESLLELVQQLGFVAIAAADGVEALELARERTPRLILLDLMMPVMNGWQFLERRRADGALSMIPVVVVSSVGEELEGAGDVQGRLEKPINPEQLLAALRSFLPDPAIAEGTPLVEPGHGDSTILVVEDDDDTRASVAELLEEHGYRVLRANNGREAERYLQSRARPDCIVLDLWMPQMDGWTFAARLQRLEGPPIPTVVITAAGPHWGYPVPLARVHGKPLHTETFLALIRTVLAGAPATSRSSGRA